MDLDTRRLPRKVLNIQDFDRVYDFNPRYTYSEQQKTDLHHIRERFHGRLFFDRLIASPSCETIQNREPDNSPLYPPSSNAALRKLHHNIISSENVPVIMKHCLMYYLLLDVGVINVPSSFSDPKSKHPQHQQISPAEQFARAVHLPKKYWTSVQGLHFLDHFNFKPAIECLCQPELKPAFPEHVLWILFQEQEWILAWAYWRHVGSKGLDLGAPGMEVLQETVFKMLLISGIEEAFEWLREQEQAMTPERRRFLFEKLVLWALELPQSQASDTEKKVRPRPVELVSLPFNEEENEWFESFLLKGKGKKIEYAPDAVMLRRITMGKVRDALSLKREVGADLAGTKFYGMGWDALAAGLQKGTAKSMR